MKLTELRLGSRLHGVRPVVSLYSGEACLSGSLSAHPAQFTSGGRCLFGLELPSLSESSGGTQSDPSISDVHVG